MKGFFDYKYFIHIVFICFMAFLTLNCESDVSRQISLDANQVVPDKQNRSDKTSIYELMALLSHCHQIGLSDTLPEMFKDSITLNFQYLDNIDFTKALILNSKDKRKGGSHKVYFDGKMNVKFIKALNNRYYEIYYVPIQHPTKVFIVFHKLKGNGYELQLKNTLIYQSKSDSLLYFFGFSTIDLANTKYCRLQSCMQLNNETVPTRHIKFERFSKLPRVTYVSEFVYEADSLLFERELLLTGYSTITNSTSVQELIDIFSNSTKYTGLQIKPQINPIQAKAPMWLNSGTYHFSKEY